MNSSFISGPTQTIDRILVPTDLSEVSAEALRFATLISSKTHSEVVSLHLMDAKKHYSIPDFRKEHLRIITDHIRPSIKEAIQHNPNIKFVRLQTTAAQEEIFQDITAYAEDEDFDLIIMGSHGLN